MAVERLEDFRGIVGWDWFTRRNNRGELFVWGHVDQGNINGVPKWVSCPRRPSGDPADQYVFFDTEEDAIAHLILWRLMNGFNEDGTVRDEANKQT